MSKQSRQKIMGSSNSPETTAQYVPRQRRHRNRITRAFQYVNKKINSQSIGESLFVLIIIVPAVFLAGGVHNFIQKGLLFWFTLLSLAICFRAIRQKKAISWHPVILFPAALSLVAIFQTVPLPVPFIELVAPLSADARLTLMEIFSSADTSHETGFPISLDVSASKEAAVRWLAISMGLFASLNGLSRSSARRAFLQIIPFLGLIVVCLGIIQTGFNVPFLFGLISPVQVGANPSYSGPFIAPNHAGQFLLVAFIVALGSALKKKSTKKAKYNLLILSALILIGIVLTQSRGALMGAAVFLVGAVVVEDKNNRNYRVIFLSAGLGLSLIVIGALCGIEPLQVFTHWNSLSDQFHLQKLSYQELGLSVLSQSPLTGTGADAFGAVQLALVPLLLQRFSYVENDFLQILVDFGCLVPAITVAGLVLLARKVKKRRLKRKRSALWSIGLVAILLQSLFSFALLSVGLTLAIGVYYLSCCVTARESSNRSLQITVSASIILITSFVVMGSDDLAPPAMDCSDPGCVHMTLQESPLDGRLLWSGMLAIQSQESASTLLTPLVDRVVDVSGNDTGLLLSTAYYYLENNGLQKAWSALNKAMSRGPLDSTEISRWVERTPEESLPVAIEAAPSIAPHIVRALNRLNRPREALLAAVHLEETPETIQLLVEASLRLEERVLADSWAERLLLLYPDNPLACRVAANTLHADAAELPLALSLMNDCIETNRDQHTQELARLITQLVVRVTKQQETFDMWQEQLGPLLIEYNGWSLDDALSRSLYLKASALFLGRSGRCSAAELKRSEIPDWIFPTWYVQHCINPQ